MVPRLDPEYITEDRGYRVNGKISLCWIWQGSKDRKGYGLCLAASHLGEYRAHRYMYKKKHGKIPNGKQLDHLCETKPCCRPSHCEPVTNAENVTRAYRRNPTVNKRRNISDKRIRKIRRLYSKGWSYADLGRRFKQFSATIRKICLRITYQHI